MKVGYKWIVSAAMLRLVAHGVLRIGAPHVQLPTVPTVRAAKNARNALLACLLLEREVINGQWFAYLPQYLRAFPSGDVRWEGEEGRRRPPQTKLIFYGAWS